VKKLGKTRRGGLHVRFGKRKQKKKGGLIHISTNFAEKKLQGSLKGIFIASDLTASSRVGQKKKKKRKKEL